MVYTSDQACFLRCVDDDLLSRGWAWRLTRRAGERAVRRGDAGDWKDGDGARGMTSAFLRVDSKHSRFLVEAVAPLYIRFLCWSKARRRGWRHFLSLKTRLVLWTSRDWLCFRPERYLLTVEETRSELEKSRRCLLPVPNLKRGGNLIRSVKIALHPGRRTAQLGRSVNPPRVLVVPRKTAA